MAKKITGNQDGLKGGNETYNIPGRGTNIPRKTIVSETKKGQHPNHIVTKVGNKEYIKAKANNTSKDNVNND